MIRAFIVPTLLLSLLAGCKHVQNESPYGTGEIPPPPPKQKDPKGLAPFTIADYAGSGRVAVEDGNIILDRGRDMTGVVYTKPHPNLDYEITLQAKRVEGSDIFCGLTFPAGPEAHCSFVVGGWGGTVVGLSNLDYEDAYNNETAEFVDFENGRWYEIRVRVLENRILAFIDDVRMVDVDTTGRLVDVRWEMEVTKPIGIATWQTKAAIRNFSIRKLEDHELDDYPKEELLW